MKKEEDLGRFLVRFVKTGLVVGACTLYVSDCIYVFRFMRDYYENVPEIGSRVDADMMVKDEAVDGDNGCV